MGRTDDGAGPRGVSALASAVRERLRSYRGTRLTEPRPCPDCGEDDYRKHGLRKRTFAVLVDGDDHEEVTVESRRFWCRNCERTVSADLSPFFYEDCLYGKPVVDLCLALSAGLSYGAVEDRLQDLGVQVDADTVARYEERVGSVECEEHVGSAEYQEQVEPAEPADPADEAAFVERAVRSVFDGIPTAKRDGENGGTAHDTGVDDGDAPSPERAAPAVDTPTLGDHEEAVTEVLDLLLRRSELLALVREGPTPRSEVVATSHRARSTADRALSELADAGLVARRDDGYVTTLAGRLALDRYREFLDAGWESDAVELVVQRRSVLARLCEGPAWKPALVDATGRSRSTVDRAVRSLAEAGLVERRSDGFAATPAGRDVLVGVDSVLADFEAVLSARAVLSTLPHDCDVPLSVVRDAAVESEDARYRLFEVLSERLADADRYRALLPKVVDSRHLRLVHSRVHRDGLASEVVADASVVERVREELPYVAGELAAAEGFAFRQGETPPFALLLASDGPTPDGTDETDGSDGRRAADTRPEGSTTVVLATYGEDVAGVLVTDSEAAVEWATGCFAARAAAARPATETLRAAPATADLPRLTGDRLPARLRDQGFVRVDPEELDRRTPMEPATAWRSGLGLAEVRAGYAVERRRDGAAVADRLLDRLGAGANVVLLGPPGSGKSTTCKRVACRWAASGTGLAIYRETGRGTPFEAAGALEALLERRTEPVLVVVEDAVRPATNAVLEVVERFEGQEDVAFLLDARTREWHDPEGPVDARLAAVRREHVETVHVPALTEADCERLVERVGELTGDVPPVRPTDLLADVRETGSQGDEDGATPGGVFLLFHRLARHVDPLAGRDGGDVPSSLDEHVDRVGTDLADVGDRALDAGVVVGVLNAAGVAVDPAYVHAVAGRDAADHDAVRSALDHLEGEILFPAGDGATYRSIHETWSVEFLARLRETEGEAAATRRFCRCLSGVLALADDPGLRERVARAVDEPAALERVAADPAAWCAETVERLFALGRQRPKLAPLFETGAAVGVDLPAACPGDVERWSQVWLGRMLLEGGYYERAGWAFEALDASDASDSPDASDASDGSAGDRDVAGARLLGLWEATYERGDYETAREYATAALDRAREWDRPTLRARAHAALGRIANRRSDYRAARAHIQQALGIFDAVGERYRAAETVDALGEVAAEQGDFEDARECNRRSLAAFEALGDRHGQADALLNLARIAWELGDYATAREHARRSLEIYRTIGDRHGEANSLGNLGILARDRGHHEDAHEYYRRCRELYDELDDRRGEATSLLNLGVATQDLGEYADADEHYRRSLDRYRDLGDRHGEAASHSNLGGVARFRGDYGAADEHFRRSLAIKRDLGDRNGQAHELQNLAVLARCRGDYRVARDYFRRSIALYERLDNRKLLGSCLLDLAVLDRQRGAFGRARDRVEDAMAHFEDLGMAPQEAEALAERARLEKLTGDLDAARDHARQCLDRARERGTWRIHQAGRVVAASVQLCRGDHEAAERRLSAVLDTDDRSSRELPRWTAAAHRALATVRRRRGDFEAAERHLSAARDRCPDRPSGLARCRLERARLARDRGDFGVAADHAEAMLDVARDLRSPQLVADASIVRGACARGGADLGVEDERATTGEHHATAEAHLDRALAVARSVGYAVGEIRAQRVRGWRARGMGDLAAAEGRLRAAGDLAAGTGHGFEAALATVGRGAVALDRGAPAAAHDRFAAAAERLREMGLLPAASADEGHRDAFERLLEAVPGATFVTEADRERVRRELRGALADD